MSGVALRCPSCGTTQAHPGECDACYEAQVRYFCDNHTPGRWLDQPHCEACGARFGEPTKTPVSRTPAAAATVPRVRGRTHPPREGLTPPPPPPPRGGGERIPEPPERPAPAAPPDLAEFLRRLLAARARPRYEEEPLLRAPVSFGRPRRGGCLGKLVLFVFIMLAFVLLGPLLMFGGIFRLFFGG